GRVKKSTNPKNPRPWPTRFSYKRYPFATPRTLTANCSHIIGKYRLEPRKYPVPEHKKTDCQSYQGPPERQRRKTVKEHQLPIRPDEVVERVEPGNGSKTLWDHLFRVPHRRGQHEEQKQYRNQEGQIAEEYVEGREQPDDAQSQQ